MSTIESPPSSTAKPHAGARDAPIKYLKRITTKNLLTSGAGIAVAVLAIYFLVSGNVQWDRTFAYMFDYRIIAGVGYTLLYSILAMVIGIAGGAILAIGMLSQNIVWRSLCTGFVELFRALPLIILLLIFYNIAIFIPSINLGFTEINVNTIVTPFSAAIIGLALHESAYMAEIIRAGIGGVAGGQRQAAESIGMTYRQTLRWIVFPQATRLIIPPTANQFISMLKNTSLVVVIAGRDLMTTAKELYSNNFLTMELLFVAAIWYLILVIIFSLMSRFVERRFSRGHS